MNIHRIIRTRLGMQGTLDYQVASIVIAMAASTSYSERDLDFVPVITFTFIEQYIKSNKKSSGEKSMNKGYKYFSESYIEDLRGEYMFCIFSIFYSIFISRSVINTHKIIFVYSKV